MFQKVKFNESSPVDLRVFGLVLEPHYEDTDYVNRATVYHYKLNHARSMCGNCGVILLGQVTVGRVPNRDDCLMHTCAVCGTDLVGVIPQQGYKFTGAYHKPLRRTFNLLYALVLRGIMRLTQRLRLF